MKDTWACTKCGRTFTRKWSGQRHLIGVENGTSSLVTKTQYEMGVRKGVIVPSFPRPIFAKQETDIVTLFRQKLKEKFVDYLATETMQDAASRRFVAMMFMNETLGKQVETDSSDKLSKMMSKMMAKFKHDNLN